MLNKEKYPILEFDDCREAIINPSAEQNRFGTLPGNCLVISFFKEAIKLLISEGKIHEYVTISGENDVIIYKYADSNVFLMHGTIGCPACAGYLDGITSMGIEKVMFCGGGGVLDKNIEVGELMVVDGAIRDEGFSYHYAPPSRVIYAQKDVRDKICSCLDEKNLPYFTGLTWTTDAIFRETREKIAYRKEEGAKIVEMEQSGCIAVAAYRGIKYGAIIYGGDDVSGDSWDDRKWNDRRGIRYSLIELCKEIVQLI